MEHNSPIYRNRIIVYDVQQKMLSNSIANSTRLWFELICNQNQRFLFMVRKKFKTPIQI